MTVRRSAPGRADIIAVPSNPLTDIDVLRERACGAREMR